LGVPRCDNIRVSEGPYFDGDPATDSARRHLERVLKGEPPPRRWPLLLAALGGGGLWMLFRLGRNARAREGGPETDRAGGQKR
jgi:hypothetical protein